MDLMGRKVSRMQCHVGYGNTARTGCSAEVDKAYMELTPVGVYLKDAKGAEYVVPYSNVTWTQLGPGSADVPKVVPGPIAQSTQEAYSRMRAAQEAASKL